MILNPISSGWPSLLEAVLLLADAYHADEVAGIGSGGGAGLDLVAEVDVILCVVLRKVVISEVIG